MARPEGNKAFAAILAIGMTFMIGGFVMDVLIHSEEPTEPAIATQTASGPESGPSRTIIPSILPLLARADVARGQSTAAEECGACHSFNAGAPPMVGPCLYGVVGAKVAGSGGYTYSDALKKVALTKAGGTWTYEQLNRWLFDPETFAPGTLMSYAGIPGIQSRADVIAYLRTLADKPMPLPAATNP